MYKTKTNRTLADALREVASVLREVYPKSSEAMRHDRNAYRVARRLVMKEARRMEAEALSPTGRRNIVSRAERAKLDGTDAAMS